MFALLLEMEGQILHSVLNHVDMCIYKPYIDPKCSVKFLDLQCNDIMPVNMEHHMIDEHRVNYKATWARSYCQITAIKYWTIFEGCCMGKYFLYQLGHK